MYIVYWNSRLLACILFIGIVELMSARPGSGARRSEAAVGRAEGVGCRVSGVGCRVSGVGCRVSGVGVRVLAPVGQRITPV